ncbi:hypothetical protein [Amycolatopsis sp. FDAARGOS 1241]|uniref:hypothetical protein n=1 Tax=Amycolatopsis sp. FDAARGOS 1241 TaxID=2778070 RepID=UPI001EF303EA|nr:hypothetical protein [Amycolatopsis sp. FDAARGOS 1241]
MTDADTVQDQLDQAHRQLAAAERLLSARAPGPDELHAAVDGAVRISTVLADLVATVMRQAPAILDHNGGGSMLDDLLADLRHARLPDHRTAAARPGPRRPGTHLIAHPNGEQAVLDDAPAHDVADQQRPARPEPGEDELPLTGVGNLLEADPADVADQRRDAPVLEEGEPWP